MEKTTITGNAWTGVITSATTDRLLAITQGAGVLCFGSTSGITEDEALPVGAGYQIVVPQGVNVSAMKTGGASLVVVTAPFGV